MQILKNKWFWVAVVVAIVLWVSVIKKKGPLASIFGADEYDGFGKMKGGPKFGKPVVSSSGRGIPRDGSFKRKFKKGKPDINERDGRPVMSRPVKSQEAPTPDRIM